MRSLIALGLTVCVASSALAQTEVIIRRPGEKDQVIRLDSARIGETLAKMKAELSLEPLRVNTVALQNGALATEKAFAPMARGLVRLMRQPHLGVVVATMARESDKFGAYIQAVTPGSPAEKAGIMSGDIITKVAGKSLIEKDAKDDSGPGVRLISMISALTVGKPVEMELRRGTQAKTVKVTPDDDGGMIARTMAPGVADFSRLSVDRAPASPMFLSEMPSRVAMPEMPPFSVFGNDGGSFGYSFGSNGLFESYELAPLNEKLGAYFGTGEGVLVVNTGERVSVVGAGRARSGDSVVARKGAPGRITRDTAMAPRAAIAMSCDTVASGTSSTISCHGGNGTVLFGSRNGDATFMDGVPMQPTVWGRRMPPVDLGLQPGDVIVSVDGRKVTSPSQLMRIVGTYDHNDEFKLQIMRQKHAETLNVKMP